MSGSHAASISRRAARGCAVLALLLLGAVAPLCAQEAHVAPASFSAGATLRLVAVHLEPGRRYSVQLAPGSGGAPLRVGDSFVAPASGLVDQPLAIPDSGLDAGAHDFELLDLDAVPVEVLWSTPVEVLATPLLSLDAAEGVAGTRLGLHVDGLQAGRLVVDYEGVPVLGPTPVAGGRFDGEFVVPRDRPLGYGATTVAIRLLNRRSVAQQASAPFRAIAPQTDAPVALVELSPLPTRELAPGETFELSGRIALRHGAPDSVELEPMLVTDGGVPVPLLGGQLVPEPDGSFAVTLASPNLSVNHGVLARSGQLRLVVREPSVAASTVPVGPDPVDGLPDVIDAATAFVQGTVLDSIELGAINFQSLDNDLRIRVRLTRPPVGNEVGPQPIPNARVVVDTSAKLVSPAGFEAPGAKLAPGSSGTSSPDAGHGFRNQLQELMDDVQAEVFLIDPDTGCPTSLAVNFTDAFGEFELVLDRALLEVSTAWQVPPELPFLDPGEQPQPYPLPIDIGIAVNALVEGYGDCPENSCDASFIRARYDFDGDQFELADGNGGWIGQGKDWLLELELPPVPPGSSFAPIADAWLIGLPKKPSSTLNLLQGAFGDPPVDRRYLPITALGLVPDSQIGQVAPLEMVFRNNNNLYGAPESAHLYRNGEPVAPIDLEQALIGPSCVGTDAEVSYRFEIGQAHRLPVGSHDLEVRYTLAGDAGLSTRSKRLRVPVQAPPDWFGSGVFLPAGMVSRQVEYWTPPEVAFHGVQAAPPERGQDGQFASSEFDFEIPGDVENRTALTGRELSETVRASGDRSFHTEQIGENRGASRDAAPRSYSSSLGSSSLATIGSPDFMTIIDTGRIPLFRMQWGFWPLAGALIGADAWFAALYRYDGVVEMLQAPNLEQQQLRIAWDVAMKLEAGVSLFMDVSILFNLIRVRGEALGLIALGLDTGFESIDGDLEIDEPATCLRLGILFLVRATAGWCPFCIKAEDGVEVLDKTVPGSQAGNPACQIPLLDNFKAGLAKGGSNAPVDKQPAMVEDIAGQGMKAWVNDGVLFTQRLAGGQPVGGPLVLVATCAGSLCNSATGPQLAVLDVNRYVLAWSETTTPIGSDESWSATQRYRIFYRIWDGSSWGPRLRVQSFGVSDGEGSLHLASCPAYDVLGCPPGGEVAAVWSRETSFGPLSEFLLGRSQLWLSRLVEGGSGHFWTTPQEISGGDPWQNNNGRVLYTQGPGRPLLAFWVHGPSSLVQDTDQRVIRWRYPLQAGSSPQTATLLHNGVGWLDAVAGDGDQVHLAYTVGEDEVAGFMGNQQEVFTARASCSPASGCSFIERRVRDAFGRTVRGENVRAAKGPGGATTVVLRGLGYGPNSAGVDYLATDPVGVVQSTGDLLALTQGYSSITSALVTAVSSDGALHWNLATSRSAEGDLLVSSVALPQATPRMKQLLARAGHVGTPAATAAVILDDDLALGELVAAPEYRIDELASLQPEAVPGDSLAVMVQVSNTGLDPAGADLGQPLAIEFSWNGPAGVGLPGLSTTIEPPAGGESRLYELEVPVPAALLAEARQRLVATLDPDAQRSERSRLANVAHLFLGGLAPPGRPRLGGGAGHTGVFLRWDPPQDPDVVATRIYRQSGEGELRAIGSSAVDGYLDLTSGYDRGYRYYLSSLSVSGVESDLVGPLEVTLKAPAGVFRDGFEDN